MGPGFRMVALLIKEACIEVAVPRIWAQVDHEINAHHNVV